MKQEEWTLLGFLTPHVSEQLEELFPMSIESYVYVVATNRVEAIALAAKDPGLAIKDYGEAMKILKAINEHPHPGISYRVFAVPKPDTLDGR